MVRYAMRLPKELMKMLKDEAGTLGLSVNSLILHILYEKYGEDSAKVKEEPE